jgi:hypothetical protein
MRDIEIQEIPMNRKLLTSTVVAASLLVPAVAFAQSDMARPDTAAPKAKQQSNVKSGKQGTTTGMSSSTTRSKPSGKSSSRKPAGSTY